MDDLDPELEHRPDVDSHQRLYGATAPAARSFTPGFGLQPTARTPCFPWGPRGCDPFEAVEGQHGIRFLEGFRSRSRLDGRRDRLPTGVRPIEGRDHVRRADLEVQ